MGKKKAISQPSQVWIEARRRHRLSHAHVQMARELGLNPKKLGKIDNHRRQPWKLPLPRSQVWPKRLHSDRWLAGEGCLSTCSATG